MASYVSSGALQIVGSSAVVPPATSASTAATIRSTGAAREVDRTGAVDLEVDEAGAQPCVAEVDRARPERLLSRSRRSVRRRR